MLWRSRAFLSVSAFTEHWGQGGFSISLLCVSVFCVTVMASLLIADVDDSGGKASWSLQVSLQPAHALNMLEIPLVSPGLHGWYAVGIMRHSIACIKMGRPRAASEVLI